VGSLFWCNLKVQTFAKKKLKGTDMFGFVGNLDHNGMTTELSISRQRSFRDLVGRLVREGADLFFLLASL
jgi:hypothetical protein